MKALSFWFYGKVVFSGFSFLLREAAIESRKDLLNPANPFIQPITPQAHSFEDC